MTDLADRKGSVTRQDYFDSPDQGVWGIVTYIIGGLERGHRLRLQGKIEFHLQASVVEVVNGYGNHMEYCATFTQDREWCDLCGMGAGDHFHKYSRRNMVIGQSQRDDLEQAIRAAADQALSYD